MQVAEQREARTRLLDSFPAAEIKSRPLALLPRTHNLPLGRRAAALLNKSNAHNFEPIATGAKPQLLGESNRHHVR